MEGKPLSDAIITGVVAIIVCLINNWFIVAKQKETTDKNVALIQVKLEALEKSVSKHNSVIERTYKLEESTALQDAELKRLNKRLEIVEGERS